MSVTHGRKSGRWRLLDEPRWPLRRSAPARAAPIAEVPRHLCGSAKAGSASSALGGGLEAKTGAAEARPRTMRGDSGGHGAGVGGGLLRPIGTNPDFGAPQAAQMHSVRRPSDVRPGSQHRAQAQRERVVNTPPAQYFCTPCLFRSFSTFPTILLRSRLPFTALNIHARIFARQSCWKAGG
jgi:hypothetical protein